MPSENAITLGQTRQTLRTIWAADPHLPIMLWGPSGVGKSALMHDFANDPTEHVRAILRDGQAPGTFVLRAHALDNAAINGVMIDRGDYADWLPLRALPHPEAGDPLAGFVLIDEINCAVPSIQAQLMALVYDRATANYRLPDGYHVVAAGNPAESRGATFQMPSPLKRRFINIHVRADLDEWLTWASLHSIDARVMGFLRQRPNLLIVDPTKTEYAEACPRTWEYASRLLTSPVQISQDLLLSLLTDCVGPGPAGELIGYLAIMNELPDPDSIIFGVQVPAPSGHHAPAITYALISALVNRLVAPPKRGNGKAFTRIEVAEAIIRWIECLDEEYQAYLMKDAFRLGKEYADAVTAAPTWIKWAAKHQDVIVR